jgi:serine/threonine-protein kinase RsbT
MGVTWQDEIRDETDVIAARQYARGLARDLGFGITDQTRIATAVSEVARLALPTRGVLALTTVIGGARKGLECSCSLAEAGFGRTAPADHPNGVRILKGVQQLMDDFGIAPAGLRTTITMRKWVQ